MNAPPAGRGWYDDPDQPGWQRWWNGAEWSDATKPTPKQEWHGVNRILAYVGWPGRAVIAAVLVIGAGALWNHGTFDDVLYHVHLNAKTCAKNAFGATFCGDDLKQYCDRFNISDARNEACAEVRQDP
jgi:hypothetical protein